jgi:hypothetical protein
MAEREIIKSLLDSKTVDFQAIGNAVAKYGPTATTTLEGWEVFCLTMKIFIRIFRPVPFRSAGTALEMEELGRMRETINKELKG